MFDTIRNVLNDMQREFRGIGPIVLGAVGVALAIFPFTKAMSAAKDQNWGSVGMNVVAIIIIMVLAFIFNGMLRTGESTGKDLDSMLSIWLLRPPI